MNMEDFDSDGSDIDIEFKGFEYENEDENDFVPVDPLDRAQKWEFLDTEGEEEDDFRGFQVDWRTGNYQPRNTKTFSRTPGVKQPVRGTGTSSDPHDLKWTPVPKTEMKTFLGLCLCFGILKLPARRDYWRQTKWLYQTNVRGPFRHDLEVIIYVLFSCALFRVLFS